MDSLELTVVNRADNGAVHAQIKSSGDDLGLLYLTENQYNCLVNILRTGCFNKDVDFSIDNPYNSEEDEEDSNTNFFTID